MEHAVIKQLSHCRSLIKEGTREIMVSNADLSLCKHSSTLVGTFERRRGFISFLDTLQELGVEAECLVTKSWSTLTAVQESDPYIRKCLLQVRLRICLKHP